MGDGEWGERREVGKRAGDRGREEDGERVLGTECNVADLAVSAIGQSRHSL